MKKYKVGSYIITAKSPTQAVDIMKKLDDSIKDEASDYDVVEQLIADENAAVKAYNIAIKNLTGKLDDIQIAALIAIRDDENRHIENLQAIINGTVTEKNLTD